MVSRCTVVTDDEEAFAEERGVLFEVVLQRRLAGQGCGLQALRGIPVDPPHPHLDWHDSQPPRKRPRLQGTVESLARRQFEISLLTNPTNYRHVVSKLALTA